jgi:tRNA(Phe) wybutosine-synthesizing methylase Tyw3
VELTSTERLDAPVGNDKVMFYDKDNIDFLVRIANDVFEKSNAKLMKLKDRL